MRSIERRSYARSCWGPLGRFVGEYEPWRFTVRPSRIAPNARSTAPSCDPQPGSPWTNPRRASGRARLQATGASNRGRTRTVSGPVRNWKPPRDTPPVERREAPLQPPPRAPRKGPSCHCPERMVSAAVSIPSAKAPARKSSSHGRSLKGCPASAPCETVSVSIHAASVETTGGAFGSVAARATRSPARRRRLDSRLALRRFCGSA